MFDAHVITEIIENWFKIIIYTAADSCFQSSVLSFTPSLIDLNFSFTPICFFFVNLFPLTFPLHVCVFVFIYLLNLEKTLRWVLM